MRQQSSFDMEFLDEFEDEWSGSFGQEAEFESGQDWDARPGRKKQCSCGRRQARESEDMEWPFSPPWTEVTGEVPSWIPNLKKLFDAGRLGWRAGRWIDKQTGRVFGKPLSERAAKFLYQRLGRSRRLEDFVDNLPAPVKRWLYSL
jgi:hypothetical protein